MNERYVLAIDMGTGAVKVALISRAAEVAASATRPIGTRLLPQGGAEQDPHEWWAQVSDAAREVIRQAAPPPQSVAAVVCTGQWSVTVPVDAAGNALHNAISWMDGRGGRYNRALIDGWPKVGGYEVRKLLKWIKLTGGAPTRSGVDGLGHILYFKNERPEIYRAAHKFLEPMDYLNLRLTGRAAASYGTIYPYWLTDNRDANRIVYHPELLRLSGIDRDKLPDLHPVNAVLGPLQPVVAADLGLPPSTPVVMGSCDGHSAAIGAGAVRDYEGYFYVGTTSWLSCHVPQKKTDLMHMIATGPSALPGRYVVMAEQGMAGRCLEFLKDNLLFPADDPAVHIPEDPYGYLNQLAASVPPGSHGLIFTPWINGVLVPADDPFTRSAFFNQTARTTRAHYVRAVMEGVAFNLRWLKIYVEKFIGRPFPQLRFIGGGALSDVWCQIMADILRCPVHQVAHPRNANGVGAALAAFAALGELQVEDMPALVKVARVYTPDPAHTVVYDRLFEQFLRLYKRMKPIYQQLHRRQGGSSLGRPTGMGA